MKNYLLCVSLCLITAKNNTNLSFYLLHLLTTLLIVAYLVSYYVEAKTAKRQLDMDN